MIQVGHYKIPQALREEVAQRIREDSFTVKDIAGICKRHGAPRHIVSNHVLGKVPFYKFVAYKLIERNMITGVVVKTGTGYAPVCRNVEPT